MLKLANFSDRTKQIVTFQQVLLEKVKMRVCVVWGFGPHSWNAIPCHNRLALELTLLSKIGKKLPQTVWVSSPPHLRHSIKPVYPQSMLLLLEDVKI